MSRRSAAAFFLGDPAFLSDPKFRALLRRLPDPDDFNSAVGAYWIALAAARRNGSPVLDVGAETDSRFRDDLIAVGLIQENGFPPGPFKEWGAMSPQQASAGKARAQTGQRNALGRYTSEASAVVEVDEASSAVQPSLPLPSSHIPPLLEEGGAGGNNGHAERLDGPIAYFEATGKYPPQGSALHDWVERLATEYGAEVFQAALATELTIDRRPKDLLSRTESRLARAADEARSELTRSRDRDRAAARAERTARELQELRDKEARIAAEPMKPLSELMPNLRLAPRRSSGKPS